jgi:hypothetical protein
MSVSILMATDTERYEILGRIIAEAASGLNVMDLKTLDRPARLAPPAVSLQDTTAELAICLGVELQTWPFRSNSSQRTS